MRNFNNLDKICKKYNIIFMGLFGSAARGEFSPQSDIDLLVRFGKRKSLLEMVRIERKISEFLKTPVDLLTENSISPYIREKIQKELRVIYSER